MREVQPPRAAAWLLRHFGSSPNNEVIIGDLNERYDGSVLWYWRQALVTIVVSFLQEVSSHKLLAIRAIFVGWIIKTAWLYFAWAFTAAYIFAEGSHLSMQRWYLFVLLAVSVAVCAMSAWTVSRISGMHYRPMVLLYILAELLAIPVMLTVDWKTSFAGPIEFAAVALGAPAEISILWVSPFVAYFAKGLSSIGYPFESAIALWCGSISMTLTMMLGGRLFSTPPAPPVGFAQPKIAR